MTNYIDRLNWRYATKKYDSTKKVSGNDLAELKEAVRLSVSSVGLQPYTIFIIESQEAKQQLAEAASGNNKNIFADASHLFVFANAVKVDDAYVDNFIGNVAEQRQVAKESLNGFSDYIKGFLNTLTEEQKDIWTAKQAYIAQANLINSAAVLGVDTTPMEGFDTKKVNDILGLENKDLTAAVIVAVGYRHENDAQQHLKKVRKPTQELFVTV